MVRLLDQSQAADRRIELGLGGDPRLRTTRVDLMAEVIEVAELNDWRAHRNPAPFPDLTLIHSELGAMFILIKEQRSRVTMAEARWIEDLSSAGLTAEVWRPIDWLNHTIEDRLGVNQ